jgi:hypothetical protein
VRKFFIAMITLNMSRNFLWVVLGFLLLSGCSKEAVTDPKAVASVATSCFQSSFSLSKSRNPNDFDKVNQDFSHELYRCMVWKVLGSEAGVEEERKLSEIFQQRCPFSGLQTIIRKDMIACLKNIATPMVQENFDRLQAGK